MCMRKKISLLVPFRPDNIDREVSWRWLRRYWKHALPGAEIIQGFDLGLPFCKTAAVNNAFRESHGDIIVILDADCYINPEVIEDCASKIRAARKAGRHLWFVPYRRLYRLTKFATEIILRSDPEHPWLPPDPPPGAIVGSTEGSGGNVHGHHYGAMIQIMPREAFEAVGGMDERCRGWGSDDAIFVQALDTLYGKHRTTKNGVFHFWHTNLGDKWDTRRWLGQPVARSNEWLATLYGSARGDIAKMRRLVDGWPFWGGITEDEVKAHRAKLHHFDFPEDQ